MDHEGFESLASVPSVTALSNEGPRRTSFAKFLYESPHATIIRFVGWSGEVRAHDRPLMCRRKKCDFGS
eukprot:scaffold324955_cov35-Attheya_sp.AAC.1